MTKAPRPQRLKGMEDGAIEALEAKALDYAEVRDQRTKLSIKEGELKDELLALMKAQKRTHYDHGNVVIDVVTEKETVKVKVSAPASTGEDSEPEEDVNPKTNGTYYAPDEIKEAARRAN